MVLRKKRWAFVLTMLLTVMLTYLLSSMLKFSSNIPIPDTTQFAQNLSAYSIYQGEMTNLLPSDDFHELELPSSLFVNYAEKQRLVKLPAGERMQKVKDGGLPEFPNKTVLVKTFFYYDDVRNPSLGKRVIETRLLIKDADLWNVATYVWNDSQSEAFLDQDGFDTKVSWLDDEGNSRKIAYHVPSQHECIGCHQTDLKVTPIGPKLRNLNFIVERDGQPVNQLEHLQSLDLLDIFDHNQIASLPDYTDTNLSLSDRGRAYLDINCAHCHNPAGYPKSARREFDFSLETPLSQAGILQKERKIGNVIKNVEMPYLGVTTLDREGMKLVQAYLDSLR
ncbi:MAG: hypothetical protein AAFY57_15845 [Cyanobacteria bacterium J06642_2]